jgi:hypothetical protein
MVELTIRQPPAGMVILDYFDYTFLLCNSSCKTVPVGVSFRYRVARYETGRILTLLLRT